jgi:signal transduction histidine kinase
MRQTVDWPLPHAPLPDRLGHALARLKQPPPSLRRRSAALIGTAAAATVGYLTFVNPHAAPANIATPYRVLMIIALIGAGIYAETSPTQHRLGAWLIAAGLFSSLWLLNGSSDRLPFSVGVLFTGLAPVAFCGLMLLYPSGRLTSSGDRWLLALTGGAIAVLWSVVVLTSMRPPDHTPLLRCAPNCPSNSFFAGHAAGVAPPLVTVVTALWAVLAWGAAISVARRWEAAPAALRRCIAPVQVAAIAFATTLSVYAVLRAAGSPVATNFGEASVEILILVPLAIPIGLGLERLFLGQALADFVTALNERPESDPQALMALALRDPSLRIGYVRPGGGKCVDASGATVQTTDLGDSRAVTWIERDRRRVAAVVYDPALRDGERFVQAAGGAVLLLLDRARLAADLEASTADLEASRTRLVETAYAERQRIERDLHDSIQQDLVGLRIKLDMAAEVVFKDPDRGERMLVSVGRQMDDVLDALRSLARGIYPSLLEQRGLAEALKSAARRTPLPVSVDARGLGRYPTEIEVAVYFCCLEALQNLVKHAGRSAVGSIRIREESDRLIFQIKDSGAGFDPAEIGDGRGLVNMRDRMETVGGTLTVSSHPGSGTTVRGTAPLGARRRTARPL